MERLYSGYLPAKTAKGVLETEISKTICIRNTEQDLEVVLEVIKNLIQADKIKSGIQRETTGPFSVTSEKKRSVVRFQLGQTGVDKIYLNSRLQKTATRNHTIDKIYLNSRLHKMAKKNHASVSEFRSTIRSSAPPYKPIHKYRISGTNDLIIEQIITKKINVSEQRKKYVENGISSIWGDTIFPAKSKEKNDVISQKTVIRDTYESNKDTIQVESLRSQINCFHNFQGKIINEVTIDGDSEMDQDEMDQDEVDQDEVDQDEVDQDEVDQDEVDQDEVDQDEVDIGKVDQDEVDIGKVDQDEVDPGEIEPTENCFFDIQVVDLLQKISAGSGFQVGDAKWITVSIGTSGEQELLIFSGINNTDRNFKNIHAKITVKTCSIESKKSPEHHQGECIPYIPKGIITTVPASQEIKPDSSFLLYFWIEK